MIKTKRVYEKAESDDGERFLVDRLWPRGVKKTALAIEAWCKDAAPSHELRHWYHHDPDRWKEFRGRYFAELREHPEAWHPLLEAARAGTITLLYSAQEVEHNNAVALREFIRRRIGRQGGR